MDLILWRHAEAHEAQPGEDDLARSLTPRGEKEAARMGQWLDRRLPDSARILCSPARRCEQTVLALGRKYKLRDELAPGTTPSQLLEPAEWPRGQRTVVLVGHQPALGQTLAHLLELPSGQCAVRKGGLWWLRRREREGQVQVVVMAVMTPELA